MIRAQAQSYAEWRGEAKRLLASGLAPAEIIWNGDTASLFGDDLLISVSPEPPISVPKDFVSLAETVALHSDEDRWDLLYRVLYRILHGERHLLKIDVDDDVRRLQLMNKAVTRDMHKMKAFVRFRRVADSDPEHFVAWHRPDHDIVAAMAPWFRARFGSMRWSILTEKRSAHWDLIKLTIGPGVPRSEAPLEDALEDLWKDYYGSIFNPARVKIKAMKNEMPVRYWATLPESQVISDLLAKADGRVLEMAKEQKLSAAAWVPQSNDLKVMQRAASTCEGCDLFKTATQVVFGNGPATSKVVMIGEQPGDEEDQRGLPFVGPAGRLLDKAMDEAKLDRSQIYVTNAVKHFKFELRGKRRIHGKPSGIEVSACRPWLEAELMAIQPELLVCLGATAAQSLMGRDFRITSERGRFFPHRWAKELMATIHPSAILRMPEPERREQEFSMLVDDLRLVAERVRAFDLAS